MFDEGSCGPWRACSLAARPPDVQVSARKDCPVTALQGQPSTPSFPPAQPCEPKASVRRQIALLVEHWSYARWFNCCRHRKVHTSSARTHVNGRDSARAVLQVRVGIERVYASLSHGLCAFCRVLQDNAKIINCFYIHVCNNNNNNKVRLGLFKGTFRSLRKRSSIFLYNPLTSRYSGECRVQPLSGYLDISTFNLSLCSFPNFKEVQF